MTRIISLLKLVYVSLLDLIYPPYCLHCHIKLNNNSLYLCEDCMSQIKRIEGQDMCWKCGSYLGPHIGIKQACPTCHNRHLAFKRAIGFGCYEGTLQGLILQYKYGRETLLAEPLSNWAIECLKQNQTILNETDIITTVPLSKAKLRQRGFNQSEILARQVSRAFSLPLSTTNLIRIKEIPSQASLSHTERFNNIKDAFAIKNPDEFEDKTVLLVDDVMTTGATASEISRLLKKNGAKCVYVTVVAR